LVPVLDQDVQVVHLLEFLLEQPLVLSELRPDVLVLLARCILVLLLAHFALLDVRQHIQQREEVWVRAFEPADQIRVERLAS